MVDVLTAAANLDWDQPAWEQLAYWALRPELFFDPFVDVKPTNQTATGSSTTFTIMNDLAVAATPISETADVGAVALSDSQVTVTLAEYGNAVKTTALVRGTSMLRLDPIAANAVGFNAGISQDTIARTSVQGGTNVVYAVGTGSAHTARNQITSTNTIRSVDFRNMYRILRGANVPTFNGYYMAMIHPDVQYDLKNETGDLGWRDPHVYSDPQAIYNGEIGEYEGFRVITAPRAPQFLGGGSGSTPNIITVYRSLFWGRQAFAKTFSNVDGNGPAPAIFPTPVTDNLRRYVGMAWYWLGGYGVFRQAAVQAVESAASQGPLS